MHVVGVGLQLVELSHHGFMLCKQRLELVVHAVDCLVEGLLLLHGLVVVAFVGWLSDGWSGRWLSDH